MKMYLRNCCIISSVLILKMATGELTKLLLDFTLNYFYSSHCILNGLSCPNDVKVTNICKRFNCKKNFHARNLMLETNLKISYYMKHSSNFPVIMCNKIFYLNINFLCILMLIWNWLTFFRYREQKGAQNLSPLINHKQILGQIPLEFWKALTLG